MYNSKDPQIRLMQAKVRAMGPRKKIIQELKKKNIKELKSLREKGISWINKAMLEFMDETTPEFEKNFDDFVLRFEALEDVIRLKTNA